MNANINKMGKIQNNNKQNNIQTIENKSLDNTTDQERLLKGIKELEDLRDAKSSEEFYDKIYKVSDKYDSPTTPFDKDFPEYPIGGTSDKPDTPDTPENLGISEEGIQKLIDAYHSSEIVRKIIDDVGIKNFISKFSNGKEITPSEMEEIRQKINQFTKETAIGAQSPESFFESISSSKPIGKYGEISVNDAILNTGETLNKAKEVFKDFNFSLDPSIIGSFSLFYIYNKLVKAIEKMLRSRFYLSKEEVSRLSPSEKLAQELILKNKMRIHRLVSAPILALGFFGITWALGKNININVNFGDKPATVNMDNPVIDDQTKSLAGLSLLKGKIGKYVGSVTILTLGFKSFNYALNFLKDFGIDLYDISCIICIFLCVLAIAYNIISLILLIHFHKNDTEISGIFPKFINSYLIALKTVARSVLYVNFVKLYPTYIFIYFLFLIVCIIARVYISPLI